MAALPGVSFATANDGRQLQDTPFDTADQLGSPACFGAGRHRQVVVAPRPHRCCARRRRNSLLHDKVDPFNNFGLYFIGTRIYHDVKKKRLRFCRYADSRFSVGPPNMKAYRLWAWSLPVVMAARRAKVLCRRARSVHRTIFSDKPKGRQPRCSICFLGPRVGATPRAAALLLGI